MLTPILLALAPQSSLPTTATFDATIVPLAAGEFFAEVFDADGDGDLDALTLQKQSFNTWRFRLYLDPWRSPALAVAEEFSVTFGGNTSNLQLQVRARAADLDGDGRAELVLANRDVVVLLEQDGAPGVPQFVERWRAATFGLIEDLALGDLDGDGRLDVAALTGLRVHAWLATASLDQFNALPPATTPEPFRALAALDLRSDQPGDELLVAGPFGTSYYVVGALAGPSFVAELSDGVTPAGNATLQADEIEVGDLDGQPGLEALVSGANGRSLIVRPQPGGPPISGPVLETGRAQLLTDVDGDGDLDGVRSGLKTPPANPGVLSADHRFEISLNDGTGGFAEEFSIQNFGGTRLVAAADVDGDGDIDLIGGQGIYASRGPLLAAPGTALKPFPINEPVNPRLAAANLLDAEGDGDLDLYAGYGDFSLLGGDWLRNAADGQLTPVVGALPPPTGGDWGGPGFPIDVDGDGDPDRLVSLRSDPQTAIEMRLLENRGGVLIDVGPAAGPGVDFNEPVGTVYFPNFDPDELDQPRWSLAADADGDGDQDLFVHRPFDDGVTAFQSRLWINEGDGSFSRVEGITAEVQAALDLDGDGAIDLVTLGAGNLRVRWGTGTPLEFGPGQILDGVAGGGGRDTIAVADFDADGDLDIAYPGVGGEAGVAFQEGPAKQFQAYRFDASIDSLGFVTDTSSFPVPKRAFAIEADGDPAPEVLVGPARTAAGSGPLVGVPLYAVLEVGPDKSFRILSMHAAEPEAAGDMDADGDTDLVGTRLLDNLTFDGPQAGLAQQFGTAAPGTPLEDGRAVAPVLGMDGIPRAGQTIVKHLRGATGGSLTYFAVGFAAADPPLAPLPGIDQYVLPPLFLPALPTTLGAPGVAGDGGWDYPFLVDAPLIGLELIEQVLVLDFTAPFGASSSNALRLVFGG